MLDFTEYLKIFIGLLAIVNPVGAVPLFIGMTSNVTDQDRKYISKRTSVGVATILLVSLFLGEAILQLFAITIDSFRVGGGILILLLAISMLHAKTSQIQQTQEEADESIDKDMIAIVPLAMPLLAGPGAISTVILAAHKSPSLWHLVALTFSILLVTVVLFFILRLSPWLAKKISTTGINIFSRIMGLILSAIAIEFIANGLKGLFPALTGSG